MTDGPIYDTRIRLDIAYDGTAFSGWARQAQRRTVQGELTQALTNILRCPIELAVAGRTDAGVHARGQVAHFDIPQAVWHDHEPKLVRRLAGVLPDDIRVFAAHQAHPDFHARFGALRRHYRYRVTDQVGGSDPLRRRDTLWWPRHLDQVAMAQASKLLCGEHDFAAYCRRREGATTIRRLERLDWENKGGVYEVWVSADAFCHSMVRSLIGALLAVGEGRRSPEWPAKLLSFTERANEVMVAPPHGLTLMAVDYPPDEQLAERLRVTRRLRIPSGNSSAL